jgi:hypothetical protein
MTPDSRGEERRRRWGEERQRRWGAVVQEEGHRRCPLLLSAHLYNKGDFPVEEDLEGLLCRACRADQWWEVEVECNYHLREVAVLVRWDPTWEVVKEDHLRWGTWQMVEEGRSQWGIWEAEEDLHRWVMWEAEEDNQWEEEGCRWWASETEEDRHKWWGHSREEALYLHRKWWNSSGIMALHLGLIHHLLNREEVLCIKCLDIIKCLDTIKYLDICLLHNDNPFPLDLEGVVLHRIIWHHRHHLLGRHRHHLDIATLLQWWMVGAHHSRVRRMGILLSKCNSIPDSLRNIILDSLHNINSITLVIIKVLQ